MTSLKISKYWLCQLGGWLAYVSSFIFFWYSKFGNVPLLFCVKMVIMAVLGIALTHALRFVIIQNDWLKLSFDRVWFILLCAVLVTSLVFTVLHFAVYYQFNLLESRKITFGKRVILGFMDNTPSLMLWVLIYYTWHFVENNRKQQLESLRLEALVKEMELKTIKSHINPHFIFNALNSIRALVDENPSRARTAITELSNILRSSMQTEKMETVPLEKELGIVKDYLALEKIRFEERLKVEFDIDENTLDEPVPVMMLQTLVENAIKHGISKRMEGGIILVKSHFVGKQHVLIVQNTGHLNGNANPEGFGIMSTQSRLSILYGPKANFEIKDINPNMVEAKVQIPVEPAF